MYGLITNNVMFVHKTCTLFLFLFHNLLLSKRIMSELVLCMVEFKHSSQCNRGNSWDIGCMFKILEVNSNRY